MSAGKWIRQKIKSIQSTRKITRAMEMVAASKMRKSRVAMELARPYAEKIRTVIHHLRDSQIALGHPFLRELTLEQKAKPRVGYIIISSDRGLCGGLNINLFRLLLTHLQKKHPQRSPPTDTFFCTVGRKAENLFKRLSGGKLLASVTELQEPIQLSQLIGVVKVMLDAFLSKELDEIYLASNQYVNTMTQSPKLERLLPVSKALLIGTQKVTPTYQWDYLYESPPKILLEVLLTRYLESLVFQGAVENLACEQAARMVAMKNASDNANDLIDELLLQYNKARQAAITQELSEIVSGAAAV